MYLLYLDESGNENAPADSYFVLAGAAIFERQTHFLAERLNLIEQRYFPGSQPIPFHASPMRTGKDFWRKVAPEVRKQIILEMGSVIADANDPGLSLFAVAVEKSAQLYGEAAVQHAVEQISGRFDKFLGRRRHSDPQRGLLIFAEGRFDKRVKIWIKGFKDAGTRLGELKNFAEGIPYLAGANESRLLQLADYVAHAVFIYYERSDDSLIRLILPRFDSDDNGVLHGLVHHRANRESVCNCPACSSRSRT